MSVLTLTQKYIPDLKRAFTETKLQEHFVTMWRHKTLTFHAMKGGRKIEQAKKKNLNMRMRDFFKTKS